MQANKFPLLFFLYINFLLASGRASITREKHKNFITEPYYVLFSLIDRRFDNCSHFYFISHDCIKGIKHLQNSTLSVFYCAAFHYVETNVSGNQSYCKNRVSMTRVTVIWFFKRKKRTLLRLIEINLISE